MKIAYDSLELVNQYNQTSSGHFFDRGTMRFFNSKLTSNYKRLDDNNALFITTEKSPWENTRKATVRHAELVKYTREHDDRVCYKLVINTVGEFNTLSLYQAKKLMNSLTSDEIK
jgi:hypothetical protein